MCAILFSLQNLTMQCSQKNVNCNLQNNIGMIFLTLITNLPLRFFFCILGNKTRYMYDENLKLNDPVSQEFFLRIRQKKSKRGLYYVHILLMKLLKNTQKVIISISIFYYFVTFR